MRVNQPGIAGSGDMYYVYSDHLGSILTVTDGISNTYNQSFDAWGNYRNPTNGSYTSLPTNPSWLYRGYTGHEHLPEFQLINANGRLYDPLVNSFLSPDPYEQAPTNTQNYNRYSYCLNNPLKYTDPSGMMWVLDGKIAEEEASAEESGKALEDMDGMFMHALNDYEANCAQTAMNAQMLIADWENSMAIYGGGAGGPAFCGSSPSGNTGTVVNQEGGGSTITPSTPGQISAIVGQSTLPLPPVTTYGVTPTPFSTGDGGDLSELAGFVIQASFNIAAVLLSAEAPEASQELAEEGDELAGEVEAGPVQQAIQSQQNFGGGIDYWGETTLYAGDMVGRTGDNATGNYYFNVEELPTNMSNIYQQFQIPGPQMSSFTIYQLNSDIQVGISTATQNPLFGYPGGGLQYFIPNPTQNLTPIFTITFW